MPARYGYVSSEPSEERRRPDKKTAVNSQWGGKREVEKRKKDVYSAGRDH